MTLIVKRLKVLTTWVMSFEGQHLAPPRNRELIGHVALHDMFCPIASILVVTIQSLIGKDKIL